MDVPIPLQYGGEAGGFTSYFVGSARPPPELSQPLDPSCNGFVGAVASGVAGGLVCLPFAGPAAVVCSVVGSVVQYARCAAELNSDNTLLVKVDVPSATAPGLFPLVLPAAPGQTTSAAVNIGPQPG